MKIRHLKHHEIDKEKWDNCVNNATNGIVYAYSWYLDSCCDHWEALIEDDYVSVFPLTTARKFGLSYLYQPYFAQQLGLFSINTIDPSKVNIFLKAIPNKYKLIEIKLSAHNSVPVSEFQCKTNVNYELSLHPPYEKLYAAYSTNTKRNIKKAVKNCLQITTEADPDEMVQLFKKNKGKEYNNLTDKNYENLRHIISACNERNTGKMYGVLTPDRQLCAAAYFIFSHNRWIFIFSGNNQAAKQRGAMAFLMDAFIKDHTIQNLVLDFEGSNDKGVARFYKSFGSEKTEYLSIRRSKLPYPIRWLKK